MICNNHSNNQHAILTTTFVVDIQMMTMMMIVVGISLSSPTGTDNDDKIR